MNPKANALTIGGMHLLSQGYSPMPRGPLQGFGVAGMAAMNAYNQSLDAQFERELAMNQLVKQEEAKAAMQMALSRMPPGAMTPEQQQALQVLAQVDPSKALEMYMKSNDPMRGSELMDDAMMGLGGDVEAALNQVNQWRMPRGPSTVVQMSPGDTEDAKRGAGYWWDQYTGAGDAAKKSKTELNRYEEIDRLLNGLSTGNIVGNDAVQAIIRGAEQFGIPTEAVTGAEDGAARMEAASALARQIALGFRNPAGGEGMPGHLSNQDRAFLMQMSPGVVQSPEGRRLIVEYRKRLAEKASERYRFMTDLQSHNLPVAERVQKMAEYDNNQFSIFQNADGTLTDLGEEAQALSGSAEGGAPAPDAPNVVTFQTMDEARAAWDQIPIGTTVHVVEINQTRVKKEQ